MLALAEYESGICDGCGFHSSVADEDPYFTLEEKVCPVCAQTAAEIRARDKAEQESGSESAGDGRKRYLRLLAPSEAAKMQSPSVAEKTPGD